jgi:hypothetical protein
MPDIKAIHERSVEQRREAQYKTLQEWDTGKITGQECIEKIVMLEKFIPLNQKIIHGNLPAQ